MFKIMYGSHRDHLTRETALSSRGGTGTFVCIEHESNSRRFNHRSLFCFIASHRHVGTIESARVCTCIIVM